MPRIRNAQIDLLSQMDELMAKSIVTVAAAVSILSLGSLVSAQAGGATSSAPSRYNGADRG